MHNSQKPSCFSFSCCMSLISSVMKLSSYQVLSDADSTSAPCRLLQSVRPPSFCSLAIKAFFPVACCFPASPESLVLVEDTQLFSCILPLSAMLSADLSVWFLLHMAGEASSRQCYVVVGMFCAGAIVCTCSYRLWSMEKALSLFCLSLIRRCGVCSLGGCAAAVFLFPLIWDLGKLL